MDSSARGRTQDPGAGAKSNTGTEAKKPEGPTSTNNTNNNSKNVENSNNPNKFKDQRASRSDKNEEEEENESTKEKIGARSKPKTTMTCELCKKDVPIFMTECDTSGLAWHSKCFRCKICKVPLNENTVQIRGEEKNQLFCSSHAKHEKGIQPTCKVYFLMLVARVVF